MFETSSGRSARAGAPTTELGAVLPEVPWPKAFVSPVPLRRRGSFHLYRARSHGTSEPRLVVVPAPHVVGRAAARCLRALAAAHARLQAAAFPVLAECGEDGGVAFVSFALEALCDGEDAIHRIGESRTQVPYAEAMAVVARLGASLELAHRTFDECGRPLALGGMGWANVVVGTDGMPYLVGLGHNVVGRDEHGDLCGAPSFFVPPGAKNRAAPTPSADVFAFVMLQRSVLSYCVLPPAVEAAFAGGDLPPDHPVRQLVDWAARHVIAATPAARADMSQVRRSWERECECLALVPDLEGLCVRLVHALTPSTDASSRRPRRLVIGPEGAWFVPPDGNQRSLARRGPLRRILVRLVEERLVAQGRALEVDGLLAAGWPNQRVSRGAALNRVYVSVAELRTMGLRGVLQRIDDGYRIDPALAVCFASS